MIRLLPAALVLLMVAPAAADKQHPCLGTPGEGLTCLFPPGTACTVAEGEHTQEARIETEIEQSLITQTTAAECVACPQSRAAAEDRVAELEAGRDGPGWKTWGVVLTAIFAAGVGVGAAL